MKILVAEDEADTRQLLGMYLESHGHELTLAADGEVALKEMRLSLPDLVLLDVRMPKLDGWSVLEAIRDFAPQLPVLMITALDEPEDAIRGLRLGADDYLRKPFDLHELEARMEAVLRRAGKGAGDRTVRLGRLTIDDRTRVATFGNQSLALSPKEYRLLSLLASEPGRVFASEEIIGYVWGENSRADRGDVKQYVHLLRRKFDQQSVTGLQLRTVPNFGYTLEVAPSGEAP